MPTLTGSTKRSEWELRFARSLPRDWDGGRIQVDGDADFQRDAIRWIGTVILGALVAWGLCAMWGCV